MFVTIRLQPSFRLSVKPDTETGLFGIFYFWTPCPWTQFITHFLSHQYYIRCDKKSIPISNFFQVIPRPQLVQPLPGPVRQQEPVVGGGGDRATVLQLHGKDICLPPCAPRTVV